MSHATSPFTRQQMLAQLQKAIDTNKSEQVCADIVDQIFVRTAEVAPEAVRQMAYENIARMTGFRLVSLGDIVTFVWSRKAGRNLIKSLRDDSDAIENRIAYMQTAS